MAIAFALYLFGIASVNAIEPVSAKLRVAAWLFVIGTLLSLIVLTLSMFGSGWKRIFSREPRMINSGKLRPQIPLALPLRALARQPPPNQHKQHCQRKVNAAEVQIAMVQPASAV